MRYRVEAKWVHSPGFFVSESAPADTWEQADRLYRGFERRPMPAAGPKGEPAVTRSIRILEIPSPTKNVARVVKQASPKPGINPMVVAGIGAGALLFVYLVTRK